MRIRYLHLRYASVPRGDISSDCELSRLTLHQQRELVPNTNVVATTRRLRQDGHDIHPRGGMTIAFIHDASHTGDDELRAVGRAYCNPVDNYSRRIGRDIARGRALTALRNEEAWTT